MQEMSLVTVLEDPEPWFLAAQLLLCEGSPLSRHSYLQVLSLQR